MNRARLILCGLLLALAVAIAVATVRVVGSAGGRSDLEEVLR